MCKYMWLLTFVMSTYFRSDFFWHHFLNVSWWSVPYNMCTYRKIVTLIWRERYSELVFIHQWTTCFVNGHVPLSLIVRVFTIYAPFRFYVSDCIFYFVKVSSIYFKSMQLIFIIRKVKYIFEKSPLFSLVIINFSIFLL